MHSKINLNVIKNEYKIIPKKRLGQNFIFDNNILMTDTKQNQVSKGNRVLIFDKLPTSPEEDIIFISTRKKHSK